MLLIGVDIRIICAVFTEKNMEEYKILGMDIHHRVANRDSDYSGISNLPHCNGLDGEPNELYKSHCCHFREL